MDGEPLTKPYPKDDVYDRWLGRIDTIEAMTIGEDTSSASLDIGYFLFPLIDSISYTLFGSSCRKYLKELGVSHPDLVYKMFRNGLMHNMSNYHLQYDDGKISWGMSSSGGTSGFTRYDPGYISEEHPELNMPPENIFRYKKYDNGYIEAHLQVDRLAAQIRYDLRKRKQADTREEIDLIIGKVLPGKMPSEL